MIRKKANISVFVEGVPVEVYILENGRYHVRVQDDENSFREWDAKTITKLMERIAETTKDT